ncbi:MAG TPA: hypothetical protein VH092_34155 [Urbifossiella sp.]|jgi:hypothetical protein|nr:hypothetical protein [Urbifossiella sp.]
MVTALFRRCLSLVPVLLAIGGPVSAADAGWVTIQNDTGRVVVIQTTVEAGGQTRRGRPIRLLPGEHHREFHTSAALQVEVFDGQPQDRSLYCGTLHVRSESQTFLVTPAGRSVTVAPAGGR